MDPNQKWPKHHPLARTDPKPWFFVILKLRNEEKQKEDDNIRHQLRKLTEQQTIEQTNIDQLRQDFLKLAPNKVQKPRIDAAYEKQKQKIKEKIASLERKKQTLEQKLRKVISIFFSKIRIFGQKSDVRSEIDFEYVGEQNWDTEKVRIAVRNSLQCAKMVLIIHSIKILETILHRVSRGRMITKQKRSHRKMQYSMIQTSVYQKQQKVIQINHCQISKVQIAAKTMGKDSNMTSLSRYNSPVT